MGTEPHQLTFSFKDKTTLAKKGLKTVDQVTKLKCVPFLCSEFSILVGIKAKVLFKISSGAIPLPNLANAFRVITSTISYARSAFRGGLRSQWPPIKRHVCAHQLSVSHPCKHLGFISEQKKRRFLPSWF